MRGNGKLTVGLAILAALMVVDSALAYYNPRTGRLLSRDPIGETGHMLVRQVAASGFVPRDPAGVPRGVVVREASATKFFPQDGEDRGGSNRYAFVLNNPVSLYDPLGEECGGAHQAALRKCGDERGGSVNSCVN